MIDRRNKEDRHLVILDVEVISSSGTCRAELLDISRTGAGVGWINSSNALRHDDDVQLVLQDPPLKLGGKVRGDWPVGKCRPNGRSTGVQLDSGGRAAAGTLVSTLITGRTPPVSAQRAFKRAWNGLKIEAPMMVEELHNYLEGLRQPGVNGSWVTDSLEQDENCPGHRMRNLFRMLLEELRTGSWGEPLGVYEAACKGYSTNHYLGDMGRDAMIDHYVFGPLISRFIPRDIVEGWIEASVAQRGNLPRDLIDDVLEEHDESFQEFLDCLDRRRQLGCSEKTPVWCVRSKDVDRLFYKRDPRVVEMLSILGKDGPKEEHIEVRFPASKAKPLYKPCCIHAGSNSLFRSTQEGEKFGLTSGTDDQPGVPEAVHEPRLAYDCLCEDAELRAWRL